MTEKEKDCGTCKYFQLDGMFGMWCDLGKRLEKYRILFRLGKVMCE